MEVVNWLIPLLLLLLEVGARKIAARLFARESFKMEAKLVDRRNLASLLIY